MIGYIIQIVLSDIFYLCGLETIKIATISRMSIKTENDSTGSSCIVFHPT
jgi:hypothetical protein